MTAAFGTLLGLTFYIGVQLLRGGGGKVVIIPIKRILNGQVQILKRLIRAGR